MDVDGRVATAGFWNCHVHFTEPVWREARGSAQPGLQDALDDMLLSRGFTTALDLGSDPRTTLALARRIEAGELRGPAIITAAGGIYPHRGLPFYVKGSLPWFVRPFMPNPATPLGARLRVGSQIRRGAGLAKLFTGSYTAPGVVKPMRDRIAGAAVDTAHRRGCRVFAHPSNLAGTEIAVHAGVDVLAHVPDQPEGTAEVLREAARRGIRIVPTLHMFAATVTTDEAYLGPIREALRGFRAAGGRVLFGTDVGYLTDRDTTGEFAQMHAAGMNSTDILRSLTSEPAALLGQKDAGEVRIGSRADLTILETRSDPEPTDFARVHAVIRGGAQVYGADG